MNAMSQYVVTAIVAVVITSAMWAILLKKQVGAKTKELFEINQNLDTAVARKVMESDKLKDEALVKSQKLEDTQKSLLKVLNDVEEEKNKFYSMTARFNLATKAANIGVWEWDLFTNSIEANDIFYGQYGATASEFKNAFEGWLSFLVPTDRDKWRQSIQASLAKDAGFDITFQTGANSVRGHSLRVSAKIERDEHGLAVRAYGVQWDVTREQEIDRQKTEFVSLASHQLRTPLTAISWNVERLLRSNNLTDKERKNLEGTYEGSLHMIDLVNSLLNVSRMELDTFAEELKPTDLIKSLEDVKKDLGAQLDKNDTKIETQIAPGLAPYPADENIVKILLMNLLSNASKYSRRSSTVQVAISYLDKGTAVGGNVLSQDSLVIAVADRGIGVPANQQDKIFTKMFRAENAQMTEVDGTGLGLYLVKEIAEKNKGSVWFVSEENKGSTFFVALPASGMIARAGTSKLS